MTVALVPLTSAASLAFSGNLADATGVLALVHGGTNNNATPGTGQISYSDGTKLTSDSNLTWDATNGLLVKKNLSLNWGTLIAQSAALATNATDGFLYIPTSAGAPIGTPTAHTGTVATEYDTTNDLLKVYNSSWKTIPPQATGSWTPADNSGATLSFSGVSANYTKLGN